MYFYEGHWSEHSIKPPKSLKISTLLYIKLFHLSPERSYWTGFSGKTIYRNQNFTFQMMVRPHFGI